MLVYRKSGSECLGSRCPLARAIKRAAAVNIQPHPFRRGDVSRIGEQRFSTKESLGRMASRQLYLDCEQSIVRDAGPFIVGSVSTSGAREYNANTGDK